jgi:hypothetical protein
MPLDREDDDVMILNPNSIKPVPDRRSATAILLDLRPAMPSEDIITAYNVAVPHKQEQSLPGLDKDVKRVRLYFTFFSLPD